MLTHQPHFKLRIAPQMKPFVLSELALEWLLPGRLEIDGVDEKNRR